MCARGPLRARGTGGALRTLNALIALEAPVTLGTLRSSYALRPRHALRTGHSLRPEHALRTFNALGPGYALRAFNTLVALEASIALRTRRTLNTL
jgi:hypothetical protein